MAGKKLAMSAAATVMGVATLTTAPDPAAAHEVRVVAPGPNGTAHGYVRLWPVHNAMTVCNHQSSGYVEGIVRSGTRIVERFIVALPNTCRQRDIFEGITEVRACSAYGCTAWKAA